MYILIHINYFSFIRHFVTIKADQPQTWRFIMKILAVSGGFKETAFLGQMSSHITQPLHKLRSTVKAKRRAYNICPISNVSPISFLYLFIPVFIHPFCFFLQDS